jgi:hypothetical protein
MATYVNNLRLKEITTGDEDGTWGTSTNTNLELITDSFSYGTKQMAADANETFTMPDATADATRGFYLKITSAASLTATREVTLGPNTVSKVWLIENATTGSQIITIKQGSGATVNIANGSKVMVVTDGLGSGAAVINATPTETATGDVTLNGTQTLTNKDLTSATNTFPTTFATLTGTQTLTNKTVRDTIYTLSGLALDATNGGVQTKTLGAAPTFTDSMTSGDAIVLQLEGGASYTVTWPSMIWVTSAGNVAPTLTAKDTLVFWKVSTTLYGAYTGSYV